MWGRGGRREMVEERSKRKRNERKSGIFASSSGGRWFTYHRCSEGGETSEGGEVRVKGGGPSVK